MLSIGLCSASALIYTRLAPVILVIDIRQKADYILASLHSYILYTFIFIVLLYTPQYTSYVNTKYVRCEEWVRSHYVCAQFGFLHLQPT